jgi:metal-responsive CopG/Arc/MetJ family transcriptional regulator
MAQRAIRFSDHLLKRADEASKERGFALPSAFIRYAVEQELSS